MLSSLTLFSLVIFTLGALLLLFASVQGRLTRAVPAPAVRQLQVMDSLSPTPIATVQVLEAATAALNIPVDSSTATPVPVATATPTGTPTATPIIHTVTAGQTLWEIAYLHYGDGNMWSAICEANRQITGDCTIIATGQTLVIPGIFGE